MAPTALTLSPEQMVPQASSVSVLGARKAGRGQLLRPEENCPVRETLLIREEMLPLAESEPVHSFLKLRSPHSDFFICCPLRVTDVGGTPVRQGGQGMGRARRLGLGVPEASIRHCMCPFSKAGRDLWVSIT